MLLDRVCFCSYRCLDLCGPSSWGSSVCQLRRVRRQAERQGCHPSRAQGSPPSPVGGMPPFASTSLLKGMSMRSSSAHQNQAEGEDETVGLSMMVKSFLTRVLNERKEYVLMWEDHDIRVMYEYFLDTALVGASLPRLLCSPVPLCLRMPTWRNCGHGDLLQRMVLIGSGSRAA